MVLNYQCVICSFVYGVDRGNQGLTPAPAPVHPSFSDSGKTTWTMCGGSGRPGKSVP